MLADTTTWHRSWWTFTGFGCRNASNTNCPCSCIVASTELHHDTWQSWQRPSAALSTGRRRRHLPILSCQLHVDRAFAVAGPRAWNSLPPAVRSSATYNIFKKDLKSHLFGLSFLLWQYYCVFWLYVQRSCLYRLLRFINCPTSITLHYITSLVNLCRICCCIA